MSEDFRKVECKGPLCQGVRLRLVSQIGDKARGWCFACLEHERSQQRMAAGKLERAELEAAGKASGLQKKTKATKEETAMEQKRCGYCKAMLPVTSFEASPRRPGELRSQCKACHDKLSKKAAALKKAKTSSHEARSTAGVAPIELKNKPWPPVAVAAPEPDGATAKVLGHSHRLLSIALLGPRPQDHDFIRALCVTILQDTLVESKVPSLADVSES